MTDDSLHGGITTARCTPRRKELRGKPVTFAWSWPAALLVGSALVKVLMYLWVRRLGEMVSSPAIMASARDNLADVVSACAALAGVVAAGWVHPLADPLAGVAVSLWIFRNALGILTENLGYLTGRAAEQSLLDLICQVAGGVDGVVGVHGVIADYVGPQVRAEIHVDVDSRISFLAAHEISVAVHAAVASLNQVDLAFVHLEPILQTEQTRAKE